MPTDVESNATQARLPSLLVQKKHKKNASRRVRLWRCGSAGTRAVVDLAAHSRLRHIVDDRVHGEGALRPRFVQLRVHESSEHTPAQELLVEQVPYANSIVDRANRAFRNFQMATVVECSPSFDIVRQSCFTVWRQPRPLDAGTDVVHSCGAEDDVCAGITGPEWSRTEQASPRITTISIAKPPPPWSVEHCSTADMAWLFRQPINRQLQPISCFSDQLPSTISRLCWGQILCVHHISSAPGGPVPLARIDFSLFSQFRSVAHVAVCVPHWTVTTHKKRVSICLLFGCR